MSRSDRFRISWSSRPNFEFSVDHSGFNVSASNVANEPRALGDMIVQTVRRVGSICGLGSSLI